MKGDGNSMKRSDRIYIAGHRGLAGSGIWNYFSSHGYTNLVGLTSAELDLTQRDAVFSEVTAMSPDVVIDAAAKVGGISANAAHPSDFLSQNLQIQVNLMDACRAAEVRRFLFLGSSCIYPKMAEQPLQESALLSGPLEETNSAYAIAKIAGISHVQSVRKQFGYEWISAMPTNLYGPNDNYHPENSHVFAALIRKFHEAKLAGDSEVIVWGTGMALREFMHVDDLSHAIEFLLHNYNEPEPVNIGSGHEISIKHLAEMVAQVVGFDGGITYDRSKPDGTPRKTLDSSRLRKMGWTPRWDLRDGLIDAYNWFRENYDSLRMA